MNSKRKKLVIRFISYFVISLAFSFSALANDTITFTWQANTTNGKEFFISATGNYTIHWGNGVTNARTAGYFDYINYTYPAAGTYTVTIAATATNCSFIDLFFYSTLQISRLDVSNSPALEMLVCQDGFLDTLDLSKNTDLWLLDCQENQLKSLIFGNKPLLETVFCHNNLLSSLDVSGCTALVDLYCDNNLLDSLNVNNNTVLEVLECFNNNLSSLNLSNNFALTNLSCDTNHLPLSVLYAASQKIAVQGDKQLGYQTLAPQTVLIGDTLFQTESVFNSIYTNYAVTKNGSPASTYTTSNGKLIFSDTGIYNVTMTNSAIVSDVNFPAKVVVNITVLPSTMPIITDTIRFTWQAGTMQKAFYIQATLGEQFTVSWGDGIDSIYIGMGSNGINPNHTYDTTGYYNVTVAATTVNGRFVYLWCNDKQLSSIDVSKSTSITDLYCERNALSNLDVSNNTALKILYCPVNSLTNLDVSNCTSLIELYCNNNLLNSLDVSKNTNLIRLVCGANQLSTLDVNKNTALTTLNCDYNQLSTIDVSNNRNLMSLVCHLNQLDSLDVSNNTALTMLYCSHNPIDNLYLNNNISLTHLYCDNNSLNSLDVSNNKSLNDLRCNDNQLNNLDISNNINLTILSCIYNSLSSLDLSNNTVLTHLNCYNNHLPLSDLFAASEVVSDSIYKYLGLQTLPPQTVLTGDTLFQTESVFNSIYTMYAVTKNGVSASSSDYIVTNGAIIFKDSGNYNVTMTNAAIISHASNPAKVIVDIEVIRIPNTDATLSDLICGELEPAFNSNIFEYTVCLKNALRSIGITAIPNDPNATVIGDGQQQLTADTNVFVVTVTAEDGITTLNYTITVINGGCGEIGTDASLANLTVSTGELEPAFNTSIFEYTVCINGAKSITLTATPTDSNATVVGDGQQQLYQDTNIFVITVTAEDGTTTQNYVVTVINNCDVGINNYELPITNYVVYPNPTTGQLRITNYELRENTVIELFDIYGKCYVLRVTRNEIIDISHLANGMYFLKVDNKVVKIIKN